MPENDEPAPDEVPQRPQARRPVRRREEDYDDEPHDIGQDAGMRMLLPVGRSTWAIASGYLGLISVLILPAPLALWTGIMALREMKRNPKKHGKGRAIFGIIMGGLGTLAILFGIVAMIVAALK
jgi:hypothetical protein